MGRMSTWAYIRGGLEFYGQKTEAERIIREGDADGWTFPEGGWLTQPATPAPSAPKPSVPPPASPIPRLVNGGRFFHPSSTRLTHERRPTYARRGTAPAEFLAWLDAVEAECETRCGHPREALRLINHAEHLLAESTGQPVPDWFNWFSPISLASFKGDTQLKAGQPAQAKATLLVTWPPSKSHAPTPSRP